ncbi:MAG: hypothetical protein ABI637_06540 [Gemmatimonadota bacterium]
MVGRGLVLALAPLAFAGGLAFHPMHTSSAELVLDRQLAVITVRIFADDFKTLGGADAERAAHACAGISIRSRESGTVPLRVSAIRRVADVVELTLTGPLPAGLTGAELRNEILFDRYHDEVNIVRIHDGQHTSMLLFTPGSGARRIR